MTCNNCIRSQIDSYPFVLLYHAWMFFVVKFVNVEMVTTCVFPYFSFTHSQLLNLFYRQEKSKSMSGIVCLSIFKNLSNNKLYLIGSTYVIPKLYATKLPSRPGPTPQTPIICFSKPNKNHKQLKNNHHNPFDVLH